MDAPGSRPLFQGIDREDVIERDREAREEAGARGVEIVARQRGHGRMQPVIRQPVRTHLRAQEGHELHQAPGFLAAFSATGAPDSFHAVKPPPMCATRGTPMSCKVLVASADRHPSAQNSTYSLSSP